MTNVDLPPLADRLIALVTDGQWEGPPPCRCQSHGSCIVFPQHYAKRRLIKLIQRTPSSYDSPAPVGTSPRSNGLRWP
jgi:hypothetical protein